MARSEENERIARQNREAFKKMSLGGKLGYFVDYYLKWALFFGFIAIFMLAVLIRTLMPAEKSALSISVVGDLWLDPEIEQMKQDLAERLGVAAEDINISDNYATSTTEDLMVIMAMLAAGDVDVMFTNEDMFTKFCGDGGFVDLSTILTEAELAEFGDLIVYADGPEEGVGSGRHPFGIHASALGSFGDLSTSGEDLICGISVNSENQEAGKDFLNYIRQEFGD